MRGIIGEELYSAKSLFAALPNFESFNAAVKIIDVDADEPSSIHWVQQRGSLIPRQTVALVINIATSGRRARVVRLSTMMNSALFSGLTDMLWDRMPPTPPPRNNNCS
jgi:hypothetical protein